MSYNRIPPERYSNFKHVYFEEFEWPVYYSIIGQGMNKTVSTKALEDFSKETGKIIVKKFIVGMFSSGLDATVFVDKLCKILK